MEDRTHKKVSDREKIDISASNCRSYFLFFFYFALPSFSNNHRFRRTFFSLSYLLYMIVFEGRTHIHSCSLSMTRFTSFLQTSLVVVVVVASIMCSSNAATQYVSGATIFGRCANFAIQAGTAISFDGAQTTVNTGNVGVAPGTSITGAVLLGTGYTQESGTTSAQSCADDEATAYGYLKALTCTNTLANSDLAGVTLTPGVYCSVSGVFTLSVGALYLDGQGDASAQFIFQTTTTVITAANTNIILVNGTMAKNIYWQVGSSATLGDSSSFMGQILAYASITVDTGVYAVGRLYAQAAVTCASAANITLPSQC
jgi:hypothetical protein